MPATLRDIAKATRTSVSTVSRVLAGGAQSRRISVPTQQRVRAAAARLGYRPNLIARTLRTRRSHTVALLVSDIANPFFAQIGSLIEQSVHRHGYSLMLCNSGEEAEREREYLRLLSQKAIDGLIVVPVMSSRKAMFELIPAGLPVVVLDRPVPGVTAAVYSDQEQSTDILCDELDRCGVRQVAIVAGPERIITHRRRAQIVSTRFKVLARHEGPAQKETGRDAWGLFRDLRPEAVICTNNFLAQGVIESILPAEITPLIACFDELPLMHLLPLPVVASCQDIRLLAEGCVQQLLPLLAGENLKPHAIVLPAHVEKNAAFESRQSAASAERL